VTSACTLGVTFYTNLVAFFEDDMSSFLLISLNIIYLAPGGPNSIIFPCCPLEFFLNCRVTLKRTFLNVAIYMPSRKPSNFGGRVTHVAGLQLVDGGLPKGVVCITGSQTKDKYEKERGRPATGSSGKNDILIIITTN
jgi:hypothetical protein